MLANQLTLKDLKSELWRCAEILRGSAVDRTDWKGYILPLLFFKRISDVCDEEAAEAREIYGEVDLTDFPELHRFTLPNGCHWRDVRETPANVGAALARAMRAIERANPETLTRVFGAADRGNREMLGDELLKDLIEGLSGVPLGNKAVGSDILGDAYEYLIGKFADITRRKKAGEFYTPRSVVRMMVELLDPQEGESIYDPACGTGGMLLGAIEHVERAGGDPRTFFGRIFGEEKTVPADGTRAAADPPGQRRRFPERVAIPRERVPECRDRRVLVRRAHVGVSRLLGRLRDGERELRDEVERRRDHDADQGNEPVQPEHPAAHLRRHPAAHRHRRGAVQHVARLGRIGPAGGSTDPDPAFSGRCLLTEGPLKLTARIWTPPRRRGESVSTARRQPAPRRLMWDRWWSMLVRSSTPALTAESAVHFASLDQGLATWVYLGLPG